MNTALIVANSAAGLAILALCIVVLYFMDLRQLRVGTAALMLLTAAAATVLLFAPGILNDAPAGYLVVAAVGVAIAGWFNVRRLIEFAIEPPGRIHRKSHAGALALAVICLMAPAISGCVTTGNLLDAEGFPKRYVSILDGITQGRQAVALAVIAGAMSPAEAVKKTEELDKAAVKLGLDRMVRAINTQEMDAALAKDNAAKNAVTQALATVAAPR